MLKIPELLEFYRGLLTEQVVPSLTATASVAKDPCSQWGALWTFSKLYNRIERRPEWLDKARQIAQACSPDVAKGMTTEEQRPGNVYVDALAIYALTEFARATNNTPAIDLAVNLAERAISRLESPTDALAGWPEPVPTDCKVHSLPMRLALSMWELGQHIDNERYRRVALQMQQEVFTCFYRKGRDLVLERMSLDNTECLSPLGTVVLPGRVIEDMAFQIHIGRDRHDRRLTPKACDMILRHLELGWDAQQSGLFLAIDADRAAEPDWPAAKSKCLRDHVNALYATLLTYEYTGEKATMEWHETVRQYCLEHFAISNASRSEINNANGETNTPICEDESFHRSRAIIYCIDTLERLVEFI